MSTFVVIAWRNLWRNRRRSILTLATIVLAVFLGLTMRSMQLGSYEAMIEGAVAYTGYIQIHGEGYWKHKSINRSFAYGPELKAALDSIANVSLAIPRLESFALASYEEQTKGVIVIGAEPGLENDVTGLAERVVEGNYLAATDDGVLVAEGLADYLQITVDDTLVLLGQGYHGMTAAGTFLVRGIIGFASPEFNNRLIYTSLGTAQYLFATPPVQVTTLSLMLEKPQHLEETRTEIKAKVPGHEVMTWKEISVELVQEIQSDNIGGIIMLMILYVVVGFGLLGTVLMTTMERQKEFGIMNGVGMRKSSLSLMLFLETLFLGIIGIAMGIAISLPILVYFHHNPIPVTGSVADLFREFNIPPFLLLSLETKIFVAQAIIVLVLVLVAFLYPLIYLQRMKIIKAMTGR